MAFVITAGCVDIKDLTCLANCPIDCIYPGDRMTYIQPDECIDCGACMPLCPQDAIFYEADLPPDLVGYAAVNADFFDGIGSPGSSTLVDLSDRDHPFVSQLPPRATES